MRFEEEFSNWLKVNHPDQDISFITVNHANGVSYRGMIYKSDDSAVAPVLPVEKYREIFESGFDMKYIYNFFAADYFNASQHCPAFKVTREDILNNVHLRLLNPSLCSATYLEDVPSIRWQNLRAIPVWVIDPDAKGTLVIKSSLLDGFKISEEEIFDAAFRNQHTRCIPMTEIIRKFLPESFGPISSDSLSHVLEGSVEMYVLTTDGLCDGASSVMDENMIKKLGEDIGSYYLIPSSVNEFIAVPQERVDRTELLEMIAQVNEMLPREEVLSYNAYFYNQELKRVSTISINGKRL